jgi:hypothetical protein
MPEDLEPELQYWVEKVDCPTCHGTSRQPTEDKADD